ncbi:MAG: NAD(P)H-hydrate dehydratase [Lachnospiraceae bacterium]|nr:NAD(P)H-hydrate dehydratase [Lachnospiraceae bacterium]
MKFIDKEYISNTLFKRKEDAHKGDFGKVLIYAGSVGMAGAAILCGKAALRTGVGLARYLITEERKEILPILQIAVPEATCMTINNFQEIDYSEYKAIVCGCGLGKSSEVAAGLSVILDNFENVLVLDADALNVIATSPSLIDKMRNSLAEIIITPHAGEAKRLLDTCEGISGLSGRKNAVCALAERFDCIAVLKGSGTLIAQKRIGSEDDSALEKDYTKDGSFSIFENTTGNPGMATGGSGDVLSGIIASLAAQGYSALDAARMGVFLHGRAGDLVAKAVGEMSVTASDIISLIPAAILECYKEES